jgi:hypothetical protein
MVANPQLSLIVRMFPGYTPATYNVSLTGTDITSYVRLEEGISFNRGSGDETSFPSAGRCSFTLNNRDYRFTPDNTSSSLFPDFKNRLPVRIERSAIASFEIDTLSTGSVNGIPVAYVVLPATFTGVAAGQYVVIAGASNAANNGTFLITFVDALNNYFTVANPDRVYESPTAATATIVSILWSGFVETIEENWNGGLQSVVQVSASDVLAQYARQNLPALITGEQLQDAPVALYPLADDTGSTSSADASGNRVGSLSRRTFGTTTSSTTQSQTFDTSDFGSDPDMNALILIRHSSTIAYYMRANLDMPAMTAGTIEGYFYLPLGAMNGVLFRVESPTNAYAIHANNPATMVQTDLSTDTATTRITGIASGSTGYMNNEDEAWHHYALTWSRVSSTTTWTLYLDGVSQGTWAESNAVGLRASQLFIGGSDLATPATCWASSVAIYDTILSDATLTDRAAASAGYPEKTSARFTRITGIAGAAASTLLGGDAAVTMGPAPTSGVNLLEVLQGINDCEDGAIYLDSRGVTQYVGRDSRDTTQVYIPIDPKYLNPSTSIMRAPARVNQVIASRPSGGSVSVKDAVSIAENGTMAETISLYVTNDADLQTVARRRFYRRATQQSRIGNVEVNLATSAPINDALLGADIGAYLSIGPLPRGNVDTLLVRVEGISDQITPSSWVRTFVTSPAYVSKSGSNWVLGTSRLDYTTTLA